MRSPLPVRALTAFATVLAIAAPLLTTALATGGSTPAPAPTGLLVGAARVSITPAPGPGDVWETDRAACATLSEDQVPGFSAGDHLAPTGSPWPENPNCIYQGGFGIGPMNPVSSYDAELGLWVRSIAIGNGTNTVVLTVLDGEGWLWDYASKCDDCGAKQLSADLAAELGASHGVTAEGIVVAATHSHAAPDFLGGWGFVPDWYMKQVTEAIRQSVRTAVTSMEPAVVEIGEAQARPWNRERRDTYRSAEEQQVGWLRAYVPGGTVKGKTTPARVIATLGAYAAHPVTRGTNGGVAHADWPGEFEHRLEERFGGVGLHFMTGLGNMSPAGATASGLAALVPPVGGGTPVTGTRVSAVRSTWVQPATNLPLDLLAVPGFFDRQMVYGPASVSVGKSSTAPCTSASAVGAEVAAGAIRIGEELVVTTGPGELFANLTNTIKEKSPGQVTLPLAQANDALGYLPQSFELNPVGQQGLGFAAGGFLIVNYEDSYAIDRCFGDKVLEETLALMGR